MHNLVELVVAMINEKSTWEQENESEGNHLSLDRVLRIVCLDEDHQPRNEH